MRGPTRALPRFQDTPEKMVTATSKAESRNRIVYFVKGGSEISNTAFCPPRPSFHLDQIDSLLNFMPRDRSHRPRLHETIVQTIP